MCIYLSWPLFMQAFISGEMSSNAGGLIRWPVLILIPLGFSLLLLQAFSELIKRFAFLQGLIPEPVSVESTKSDEEVLAERLGLSTGQIAMLIDRSEGTIRCSLGVACY